MPTYDYECTKCGHRFEVFHGIHSISTKRCPKCRGKAQKLISGGSGLIFRGSGFYITDYKKKPSQDDGEKSKAQSASSSESHKEPPSKDKSATKPNNP